MHHEVPYREILFTPGPTNIPPRVIAAMSAPSIHHRTSVFKEHFKSALHGLTALVDAPTRPIMLACSGSGAMEAALLNTVSVKQKIVVVNAGVFGERWAQIGQRLGLTVHTIACAWGTSISAEQLSAELKAHPDAVAVCLQYCESSTSVLHPVPELIAAARKASPNILVLVDAVSALATLPISFRELDIDVLVSASQKALMLPPGLSFLWLSKRAWETVDSNDPRTLYFNLKTEAAAHEKDTTAWTPAVSLILGLAESLRMLAEEGLPHVYKRHAALASATRAALTTLGLKLLTTDYPAPGVTGAFPPEGISSEAIRSKMAAHGMRIAGGQGQWKEKIFRVGHMGAISIHDLVTCFSQLELTLQELGHTVTLGSCIAAARSAYNTALLTR